MMPNVAQTNPSRHLHGTSSSINTLKTINQPGSIASPKKCISESMCTQTDEQSDLNSKREYVLAIEDVTINEDDNTVGIM